MVEGIPTWIWGVGFDLAKFGILVSWLLYFRKDKAIQFFGWPIWLSVILVEKFWQHPSDPWQYMIAIYSLALGGTAVWAVRNYLAEQQS